MTKISVAVIQALESGWLSQIPEDTYLTSMLRILDKELTLELNTFDSLYSNASSNTKSNKSIININPSIFSRWQPSLIYFICLLLTVYLINKYQIILLQNNVETVIPMKIDNTNINEDNY